MREWYTFKVNVYINCMMYIIVRCVEGWSSPTLYISCYGENKRAISWYLKKNVMIKKVQKNAYKSLNYTEQKKKLYTFKIKIYLTNHGHISLRSMYT